MISRVKLLSANPWWKSKYEIEKDDKISEWRNSEIKYDPRLRHTFVYNSDLVYSLRGPRQVGKTTLIKLQIRDFLMSGIDPWNIMYFDLTLQHTPQDLVDVVETYLKMSERQRKGNRCFIFLDEATTINNFENGIKSLSNDGKLKNCWLLASGSQAINLKTATERLPLRKGLTDDAYDKILIPMKFAEYVSGMDSDLKDLLISLGLVPSSNRQIIFKKLLRLEIDEKIDKLYSHLDDLNKYLFEYMITGGTPKVIDEKLKTGHIQEAIYTNYLDGVRGEWNRNLKKDETLLRQLINPIIDSIGTHTSWNSLSREADIGGANTVIDYINTLKNMFIVTVFFHYGEIKKIPLMKDDKKIHLLDPFFLHILNGWKNAGNSYELSESYIEDPANQGNVIEGIVGNHLIRWAFVLSKKKQVFEYSNHVFYWKDHNNKEVDYIFYDGDQIEVPIEVKFRTKVVAKELSGIFSFNDLRRKKSAIVISKEELETRDEYVLIPASVFLLLL